LRRAGQRHLQGSPSKIGDPKRWTNGPTDSSRVNMDFDDQEACIEYIHVELRKYGIPEGAAHELARSIASSWRRNAYAPQPAHAEFMSVDFAQAVRRPLVTGYVIKKSDLQLAGTLFGVLGTAAAVATTAVLGLPLALPVVALGSGSTVVLQRIGSVLFQKGAILQRPHLLVLFALRKVNAGGGCTPKEVADFLCEAEPMTQQEALDRLNELNNYTLRSGDVAKFAFADNISGLWKTDC